ncbi:dihydroxy-acid dehydratase, partial [Salmonella enterica subsp. enterica serovar Montevideo]|nr:dihydroxy-acid dehydratase [Salmonella enterica subsp. enterica serovar Montevideo]
MAQFVYTMHRVGKVVPPKRHILKNISLSFFPGAKIGVLGELFDRINNEIPYLTNIQPSGEYVTEMMWFAGGVPMVQWYLRD